MSNTNMKVALEIVVSDRGSREAGQAVSAVAQKKHEAARQERQDAAAVGTAVSVVAQKKHEAARQEQRDAAVVGAANARHYDQSRRASVQLAQQQIAASRNASSQIVRDADKMHKAREQLGIRSERSLQREIMQTMIAFKRLEQSGRVSGLEPVSYTHLDVYKRQPLNPAPQHLVRVCCDITRYVLTGDERQATDTINDRYKAAVRFLELVASGKVTLGPADNGVTPSADGSVQFVQGTRVFGRQGPGAY